MADSRHRIDMEAAPQRVRVYFAGQLIADSDRTILVRETGCRPVHYFPRADVATDRLARTERRTVCPHKGEASYWSISAGGRTAEDAAWSYERPIAGAAALKGRLAFHGDRVDKVDGGAAPD